MRKVDVIRKALILAYHPHGHERWDKAGDYSVAQMWRRHKSALTGPIQHVIEEAYHFGCYRGSEPAIEPPKHIWQLYLGCDQILDEIGRRRIEEEDRLTRELKSQKS